MSRLLQGRLPVAHSRMTQPTAHTSMAPILPRRSPLTVSGERYIGVPVSELASAGAATPSAETVGAPVLMREREASVFWFLARTLAAPKSTYLIVPLPSRRMSARERGSESSARNVSIERLCGKGESEGGREGGRGARRGRDDDALSGLMSRWTTF